MEHSALPILIQKFGGSSLATAERIMRAARRAVRACRSGNQVVVVVSARGDTTDELISLATEICEAPPAREMDMLLSTGEQISIALVAMAIQALGQPAISFTAGQIGIVTDSAHMKARIKSISSQRLRQVLKEGKIAIVAGFQGIDSDHNITTLGRGGSDTTAVALAAVMMHEAAEGEREVACEIFTDVDGVYTTDPSIVAEARKIDFISYDEMLELASVGAGVMHSRSIEFAKKFQVPLQVRSSFSDADGTWIVPESDWMRATVVCGTAIVRDEARVVLDGVPDQPGIGYRILSAFAEQNIVVDMIAQNAGSAGRASIGFTVPRNELAATLAVLRPLATVLEAAVHFEEDVSKVSVVGTGMRTQTGVAARMFTALAGEEIAIRMITTGEIKISVLVSKADGVRALRAIHKAFKLDQPRSGAGAWASRETARYNPRSTADIAEALRRDLVPVTGQLAHMEDVVISDMFLNSEEGRITIFDLPDQPGNCSSIFLAVAAKGVLVDMIVENVLTSGKTELSFSVPRASLATALSVTEEVVHGIDPAARILADAEIARLFVFGVGMRSHTGVARRMFGAFGKKGINISMINTSEMGVTVVVERRHGDAALASIKEAFDLL
jgi:aspartate kinase